MPEMHSNRGSAHRFLLLHLSPAIIAAAGLLLLELTPLDRVVSGWFFDPAIGRFPLRHDFWLDVVLYHWTKYLVIGIALVVLATYLVSLFSSALRPWRRLLLFLVLALWLAPGVVVALKSANYRSCPWDLDIYGGVAPYLSLVEAFTSPFPAGVAHTHCFPAGHAAAGFCLLAFYFVGRAIQHPGLARAGLWTGTVAGLLLGAGRVAQGAHFVSHNLWTGVICWTVMVVLYVLFFGVRPKTAHELHVSRRNAGLPRPSAVDRATQT